MINWVLRAKPWMLFFAMFGIEFIFGQLFGLLWVAKFSNPHIIEGLVADIDSPAGPFEAVFQIYYNIFDIMFVPLMFLIIISICSSVFYYAWLWAVSIGLQDKLPKNVFMCTSLFKFALFASIAYFPLLVISLILCYNFDFFNVATIYLMISTGFFAIFCSLYIFYFAAKTYKTIELQQVPKAEDYIGEFFGFWFYYIGIWIMQPKITAMAEGNIKTGYYRY